MFETLSASNNTSLRWPRSAVAALLMHAGVVIAAVAGTSGPRSVERVLIRDTIRLEFIQPPQPRIRAPRSPAAFPAPALPVPPAVPLQTPGPLQLDLPRLNGPVSNPAVFVLPPVSHGLRELMGETLELDSVLGVADVDRSPELADEVHPKYPESLRGSGLGGVVELEYIISSQGRVGRGSMQVRTSSHPAFSRAAIAALLDAHFRPALRNGRPVPVRVRQSIRFVSR